MKITKRRLRQLILEAISLDIKKGDVILTGKYKNKRKVVKSFGTDEWGQPTINGKSILKFKIEKNMPKSKWSAKSREELNEMKHLRQYIRSLILEKSLTGNKLEGVATTIAKEVTEYLLDDDVREAFAQRGNLQFQIEVELPEKLIWLRDTIVAMRHQEGFNVDAKYEYDLDATDKQRKDSDLIVNLYLPTDYTNEEIEEFEIEYEGSIRHELEHSGQPTDVLMHVQKTIKSGDDIWKSLENAEKYYIDQAETPAHTADWVQKSKRKGVHAADLIDHELNRIYATGQHFGYSDEELNPFMQRLREIYQYYLMSRWPEQDWAAEHRDEE